jgi:hypothetical protein
MTLVNPVFSPDAKGHTQDLVDWIIHDRTTNEFFIISENTSGARAVGITKYQSDLTLDYNATADPLGDLSYDGGVIPQKPPWVLTEGGTLLVNYFRGAPGACFWSVLARVDGSYVQHVSDGGVSSLLDNPRRNTLNNDETFAAALIFNGGTAKVGIVSVYDIGGNTCAHQDFRSGGGNDLPADGTDLCFDNAGDVYISCVGGQLVKYTRSGTTLTRSTIYTPYGDGVDLMKITHRPTSDQIILWYTNGRVARWDVAGAALTGTARQMTYFSDAVTVWNDRCVATDNEYFANTNQAAEYLSVIGIISNAKGNKPRSDYSEFAGNNSSIGGAAYDSTGHFLWVSRGGNNGFAVITFTTAAPINVDIEIIP